MACYDKETKQFIERKIPFITNRETPLPDKINAIIEIQAMTGDNLYGEYLSRFILAQKELAENHKIVLNIAEENYANKYKKSRLSFMLYGKKYIAIHSDEEVRIFDAFDNSEFTTISVDSNKSVSQRQGDINIGVTNKINSLDNEEELSLADSISLMLMNKHPLDENGEVNIYNKIFSTKIKQGLFSIIHSPFTGMDFSKGNPADAVEKIKSFIPKAVSDVIFNSDDEVQQIDFIGKVKMLSEIMQQIEIPTEKVWKNNYSMNKDGSYVSTGTKYESPNYLNLIGKEVTRKNSGDPYVELVLHDGVEEILKFYTVKAMTDMHKLSIDLKRAEASDIMKDYGFSLDEAERFLQEKVSEGEIPSSAFVKDAARDAFEQLGLTINKDIDMKVEQGIIASFEALIAASMENSIFATNTTSQTVIDQKKEEISNRGKALRNQNSMTSKELAELNKKLQKEYDAVDSSAKYGGKRFNFFKLNTEAFSDQDGNLIHEEVFSAMNKLKYISLNEKRLVPTTEAITPSRKMMRSQYEVSDAEYAKLVAQNNVKWRFKEDLKEFYEFANKSEIVDGKIVYPNKQAAMERVGYIELTDEKMSELQFDEINQIQSVNESIAREMDILFSFYSSESLKDGFYLPWGQTKGGRQTIISDLQPQESKFMRSFVEQIKNDETASKDSGSAHSFEMNAEMFKKDDKRSQTLEMAISQGLDMDPDKTSLRTILKTVRETVDIYGDENNYMIFGDNVLGIAMKSIITDENLSESDRTSAYATIFANGEGNHGVQATRMLKRLYEWKKAGSKGTFNNDLTVETDAITSGMMLTLMQIMTPSSIEFLAKGGIYTKETKEKWENYTKTWLMLEYNFENDSKHVSIEDITFTPAGLIQAGNFHQSILEDGKKMIELFTMLESQGNGDQKILDDNKDNEVFHDLYKTIGVSMQKDVKAKKSSIENRLNQIEVQLKNKDNMKDRDAKQVEAEMSQLKVAKTMLDSIGDINAKTLRGIAKSPVMVYIYGATINSIKSKLGYSMGKDTLIKAIKNYSRLKKKGDVSQDEVDSWTISFNFIDSFMNEYNRQLENGPVQKNIYNGLKKYDNNGNITKLTNEDKVGLDQFELLMHMEFTDDVMKVLQEATDMTFGSAIEQAFDDNFKDVGLYRDTVKSIELLTFELFRAKMNTKTRNIEKDGPMSKEQFSKAMKDLNNSGFGHDFPNGKPDGDKNRIPLVKFDNSGSGDRASVTVTFNKNPKDDTERNHQHRLSSGLESKVGVANTGASSTISIHSEDSNIITYTIEGDSWLSIYDAVVQASDPTNVSYSTKRYNVNTIENMANRDIVGDNVRKLNHMLNDLRTGYNNGDKDAKIELAEIRSRMSKFKKVENVFFDSTVNKNKNGDKQTVYFYPETILSKIDDVTTVTFKKNENDKSKLSPEHLKGMIRRQGYLETLTTKDGYGNTVIKEVYYNVGKDENNVPKKDFISHTVKKTISPSGVDVIESFYKKGLDASSNLHLNKINKKIEDFGFSIKYKLDNQNDTLDYANAKLITEYAEITKSGLKDIIGESNKKSSSSKTITNIGLDFKKDSDRLNLPIEEIMEAILRSENMRTERWNSFSQDIWSGHSGLSDTEATLVKNQMSGKEYRANDMRALKKFLSTLTKQAVKDESAYLNEETNVLDNFPSNINSKSVFDKASFIAKKNGSFTEFIGQGEYAIYDGDIKIQITNDTPADLLSPIKNYQRIFEKISRSGSGAYNADSVIMLMSKENGDTVTRDGQLKGKYDALKKAIEAGSTIVTDRTNSQMEDLLADRGAGYSTDKKLIMSILKNAFNDKLIKKHIGRIQLTNYMKVNGYVFNVKESSDNAGVWESANKVYNVKNDSQQTIKNMFDSLCN